MSMRNTIAGGLILSSSLLCTAGVASAQEGDAAAAPDHSADAAPESAVHDSSADTTQAGPDSLVPSYPETIAVQIPEEAPPESPAPERTASRVLEEIIVTAQKREENLKDVPISVSAFSGEALDALGVDDPKDLGLVTPGLTYSSLVGYSVIYIRGVGTDVFIPSADTSVATYIDGVYFPFAHSLASNFTKLERIEILKGPQGTLFGRNTTGGAINIVSKKPSDSFEASVDATVGNFDARNIKTFVSGPLFGNFSGSLALLYDEADVYHTFAPDSPIQSLPAERTLGYNPRLRWEATENITALLSAYITRFRGAGSALNTSQNVKPAGMAVGTRELDEPYQVSNNLPTHLVANNDVIYGNFEWRLDPLDLKLLASHQLVESDTLYDYDAGPGNGAYFHPTRQYLRGTTGELQLTSKPDGFLTFSDTLEWTAGYYYFESIGGFDPVLFGLSDPDNPAAQTPITIAGVLGDGLEILQNLGIGVPNSIVLDLRGVVETEAHAVYTQATWRPLTWFGVTLGARYQDEDRGVVKAFSGLSRQPDQPIQLFDFQKESANTQNVAPKVTLDFRPFGDDTMLYTSWQKGFKSGTYNVVTIYTPPSYVEPEEVIAVELGLKGSLLDGTLGYNVALFRNEIKDLQTLVVSLTSGGAVQLANAAEAEIKGVEFDLTWQAFPELLPGFVITSSGSYLDAVYKSFPDAPGFDETTGVFFGPNALIPSPPRDFAGNTPVRTPEFSGTLGLSYTVDIWGGPLELGANASYNSGYFYDTQNTTEQPSYTILNGRVSYLFERMNLRVTAFGKNLTEEVYYLNKFANDFGDNVTFAPPRQYGLTLGWEYY